MAKRHKFNPRAWISNVIYLLHRGDLQFDEVFAMTNVVRNEYSESLLFEHPSIEITDERVRWRPFVNIKSQNELFELLCTRFPAGLRRIDLRGLYPFVDVDLDELLFNDKIVYLDTRQDSYVARRDYKPLPNSVKKLFLSAVNEGLHQTGDSKTA